MQIESIYAVKNAFEATPLAARLERDGIPVYIVDERAMRRISDVETPSGIVAVAPIRFSAAGDIVAQRGVTLILADIGDPGNVGALLRTAEAFGACGVIAGSLGAEPHLPKVVRAAMGALFRLPIAVADPTGIAPLLAGREVTGLSALGEPLDAIPWDPAGAVVVGNERRGLGRWEPLCTRLGSIRMRGQAESLNAATAGAIALYEATKRPHC